MNEREIALETLEAERNRVASMQRLKANPDFQLFFEEVKKLRETYVSLLETPGADTKIDIIRGGLIATKDIMNNLEISTGRASEIAERIKELKG